MKPRHALICTILAVSGLAACESSNRNRSDSERIADIAILWPARQVTAGDTVTFTATTRDTYGRDARIEWSSTAGTVEPEEEGRIARVTFKETGTYSVKARLFINDTVADGDMVEVRVIAAR